MKIKEYTYTNDRNDFKAIFECTQCGHTYEAWGYADGNFYNNVMPNAICPKCNKNEKGEDEKALESRLGHLVRI